MKSKYINLFRKYQTFKQQNNKFGKKTKFQLVLSIERVNLTLLNNKLKNSLVNNSYSSA